MTASLRLTVVLYAVGLMIICGWEAVTGRQRSPTVTAALVMLEVGAVVQAVIDLIDVARGRHGGDLGVHIGYLATSLIILPVAVTSVRFNPRRWGSAAGAVACALLAIVSLRLVQTLGQA